MSGKLRRTENLLVFQAHVHKTVEKFMQEAIDKLTKWVIDIVKQTAVEALETWYMDQNKAYIKVAIKSALNGLVESILGGFSGIRYSVGDAITQVTTVPKSLAIIALSVANDTAAMAPTAWYAAKFVIQGVEESVTDLILTSSSPPPSGLDSSSDKASKSGKEWRSKKKPSRHKSSVSP